MSGNGLLFQLHGDAASELTDGALAFDGADFALDVFLGALWGSKLLQQGGGPIHEHNRSEGLGCMSAGHLADKPVQSLDRLGKGKEFFEELIPPAH